MFFYFIIYRINFIKKYFKRHSLNTFKCVALKCLCCILLLQEILQIRNIALLKKKDFKYLILHIYTPLLLAVNKIYIIHK